MLIKKEDFSIEIVFYHSASIINQIKEIKEKDLEHVDVDYYFKSYESECVYIVQTYSNIKKFWISKWGGISQTNAYREYNLCIVAEAHVPVRVLRCVNLNSDRKLNQNSNNIQYASLSTTLEEHRVKITPFENLRKEGKLFNLINKDEAPDLNDENIILVFATEDTIHKNYNKNEYFEYPYFNFESPIDNQEYAIKDLKELVNRLNIIKRTSLYLLAVDKREIHAGDNGFIYFPKAYVMEIIECIYNKKINNRRTTELMELMDKYKDHFFKHNIEPFVKLSEKLIEDTPFTEGCLLLFNDTTQLTNDVLKRLNASDRFEFGKCISELFSKAKPNQLTNINKLLNDNFLNPNLKDLYTAEVFYDIIIKVNKYAFPCSFINPILIKYKKDIIPNIQCLNHLSINIKSIEKSLIENYLDSSISEFLDKYQTKLVIIKYKQLPGCNGRREKSICNLEFQIEEVLDNASNILKYISDIEHASIFNQLFVPHGIHGDY